MNRTGSTPAAVVLVFALVLAAIPALATDGQSDTQLRRWHLGLQSVGVWRDRFDTFDRAGLPPGDVASHGRGGGLAIGRRFGDRFLAQLQMVYAQHDIAGSDGKLGDLEALFTGTVLFGPTRTVQPFLRGGLGAGALFVESADGGGDVYAFGPAAIAGGGAQIRLGSRVSLEFEAVATFTDFLEVHDETDDAAWGGEDWQVRVSNRGWRLGCGACLWF